MKVAVILTVFNRKEITLRCFRSFFPLSNELKGYSFEIFMTDDGCTDGTNEAVRSEFPQVHIVQGDGNLFWSAGMRKAWDVATKYGDFDFYLWLNDDTKLYPHALKEIFEISDILDNKALICGAFRDDFGNFTYGGRLLNEEHVIPNGLIQDVFLTNGNLLLVPKAIHSILGNIPKYFHHDGGDNDYGLRSIENGFKVVTTKTYIGECADNPKNKFGKGRKMGTNMLGRLKYLYSPMGVNPNMVFRYNLSHFGFKKALYTYLGLHFTAILSDRLYIKRYL